jgi:uncharacterized protein (DUF362 family)
MATNTQSEVFLIKTTDREAAVKSLMERFDLAAFSGKHVALKANFNSADPFPASTHLDTLQAVVEKLKQAGAAEVTLGERSGIGNTKSVLDKMGVFALSNKLGFNFTTADKVVQTCCLKTHAFGGHFTLSLKNSVGLVARKLPGAIYDYMWELHGSPYQRQMIAEINKHYKTDLVVMDGIKAFVDGGPQIGKEVQPNLMLASTDRVAIDAVGVAILRSYGSTNHVMNGRIFELDQIKRAAELDIGAQSPDQIKLIPLDDASSEPANRITDILKREG